MTPTPEEAAFSLLLGLSDAMTRGSKLMLVATSFAIGHVRKKANGRKKRSALPTVL